MIKKERLKIHYYYFLIILIVFTFNIIFNFSGIYRYLDHSFKGTFSRFGDWNGNPAETLVSEFHVSEKDRIPKLVKEISSKEPKLIVLVNTKPFKHGSKNIYFSYDLKNFLNKENIKFLESNKLKWGIVPIRYNSTSDFTKINDLIESKNEYEVEAFSEVRNKYLVNVLLQDFSSLKVNTNHSLNFFDIKARIPIVNIPQLEASTNINNFIKDKIIIIGPSIKNFYSNIKLGFHKETISLAHFHGIILDGIINNKLTINFSIIHILLLTIFSVFIIFSLRESFLKEHHLILLLSFITIQIVISYFIFKYKLLWISPCMMIITSTIIFQAYSFLEKKSLIAKQENLNIFFNKINLPFKTKKKYHYSDLVASISLLTRTSSFSVFTKKEDSSIFHFSEEIPESFVKQVGNQKSALYEDNEYQFITIERNNIKVIISSKEEKVHEIEKPIRDKVINYLKDIKKETSFIKKILNLTKLRKEDTRISDKIQKINNFFETTNNIIDFINYPLAVFSLEGRKIYSNDKFNKIMKSCSVNFQNTNLMDFLENVNISQDNHNIMREVIIKNTQHQIAFNLEMHDHFSQKSTIPVNLKAKIRLIKNEDNLKDFICFEIEDVNYNKTNNVKRKNNFNQIITSFSVLSDEKKVSIERSNIPEVIFQTDTDLLFEYFKDLLKLVILDANQKSTVYLDFKKLDDVLQIEMKNEGKGLLTLESRPNKNIQISTLVAKLKRQSINLTLNNSLGKMSLITFSVPIQGNN